jgi:molybdopterin synthase sulfur carrier subunit
MAVVTLRAPLRDRTGGNAHHDVPGATVGEALRELERRFPPVVGWILDEQGRIRAHVNVFVNGERTGEDTPLASDDVVQVLPSISGGTA